MSTTNSFFKGDGFKSEGFTDRQALLSELKNSEQPWDMIIVGGGITGAGILREACRRGLKALLIEQRDFAWGTSSRSSKMVHGGLRYIAQGDIKLTQHSLHERERLLIEAPGLVERMGYFFTLRRGQFPGRLLLSILLWLYDKLAGIKDHRYFSKIEVAKRFQNIEQGRLKGACYYTDTVTDDARLVLRVLQDSMLAGGQALNYVKAENLIKERGKVVGVVIKDQQSAEQLTLRATSVINATGAWADRLRSEVNPQKRIRPLRGSHLILALKTLPINDALTIFHPKDKRPVFIFPWEGAVVVGTTDLDHREDLDNEASISTIELNYLLEALNNEFPSLGLGRKDIISSYAGVRPVIGSERSKDPSKERRDHAVWVDKGLVTVSGGKLTTFRLIALDVVNAAIGTLGDLPLKESTDAVFHKPSISTHDLAIKDTQWAQRLIGRYGDFAKTLLDNAKASEQQKIPNTQFCLAEIRWAAKQESVIHLDDLLLRRTRLGLLLKNGGESLFADVQRICSEELHWNAQHWQLELSRYQQIWQKHYYLPKE